MVELSLLASATFSPGIFHQDQGLCRPPKEFQAQLPSHGKRQEILRSGSIQPNGLHFEDPWQSMNLVSEYNQLDRAISINRNPVLIDVQDGQPDSVHFSFGISEQCLRQEKILKFLASGSSLAEGGGFDISVLSDLMGLQTLAIDMCSKPLFPTHDELCLYEDGMDSSQHIVHPKRHLFPPKPLLDFVGSHTSSITVHPDGRLLFTGSRAEVKNLLSIVAEFYPSSRWTNGTKQAMVVPYFNWSGKGRARVSSQKLQNQTVAPLKSPNKINLKPMPKKKQSRTAGKERDLYKKNYFHACESLLSALLDKRGRMVILSLTRSSPEINNLLTQFSAGIAGTGIAVLFSVVFKVAGRRVPFSAARLLSTGFGIGLFWLSWAVNGLSDTLAHISKNSSRLKLREDEVVMQVERSINVVLFRAVALMAVAVLSVV